jgi:hypothetical protein
MSFCMDKRPPIVREALQRAYLAKTAMFGSAGNFGDDNNVSFPASSEYVFKVFAATSMSAATDISPPPAPDVSSSFAILGCDVKSIWPSKLKGRAERAHLRFGSVPQGFEPPPTPAGKEEVWTTMPPPTAAGQEELWTTMTGTSFSTPILASLVAILYQFYEGNRFKLGKDSHGFKSPQAMKVVLNAMSQPSGLGDKYNFVHPQKGRDLYFRHDPEIYPSKVNWLRLKLQTVIVSNRV